MDMVHHGAAFGPPELLYKFMGARVSALILNLSFCRTQIFLFMEVTRSGVAGGLVVANRADRELIFALVHAPTPRQQTKEDTAWNAWDRRKMFNHVTFVAVQVTFP